MESEAAVYIQELEDGLVFFVVFDGDAVVYSGEAITREEALAKIEVWVEDHQVMVAA